jgi:hypothetical protein
MKKKQKAKQRHDWFRQRGKNLTAVYELFTDDEKTLMVRAWSTYYSQLDLALLPFVNRYKMERAINNYLNSVDRFTSREITVSSIDVELRVLSKLKR